MCFSYLLITCKLSIRFIVTERRCIRFLQEPPKSQKARRGHMLVTFDRLAALRRATYTQYRTSSGTAGARYFHPTSLHCIRPYHGIDWRASGSLSAHPSLNTIVVVPQLIWSQCFCIISALFGCGSRNELEQAPSAMNRHWEFHRTPPYPTHCHSCCCLSLPFQLQK